MLCVCVVVLLFCFSDILFFFFFFCTHHPPTTHLPLQQPQKTRVEEQRQNADVLLGDVFLNLAEVLKVYRTFINNYDAASNCLAQCMRRGAFVRWVESAQERAKAKTLSSMLITPIQRIPRYCLLLADLLKHMPADHADHTRCTTALTQIGAIADYLDAEKDKAVSKHKLRHMEACISNLGIPDLSEYSWRRFFREGPLILETAAKSSEYVYLWLLTDLLVLTTQKGRKFRMRHVYSTQTMAIFNLPNESDEGGFPQAGATCGCGGGGVIVVLCVGGWWVCVGKWWVDVCMCVVLLSLSLSNSPTLYVSLKHATTTSTTTITQ
jgi:RhoGEF domain